MQKWADKFEGSIVLAILLWIIIIVVILKHVFKLF